MYSFISIAHICYNFLFIEPNVPILLIFFEIFSPLYYISEYSAFQNIWFLLTCIKIKILDYRMNMVRKNSAFFSISMGVIMIHEWRIFVHLNENVPLYEGTHRPTVACDVQDTATDVKFADACKQRDLTQMRNVLLDLEDTYRRNCNFADARLMNDHVNVATSRTTSSRNSTCPSENSHNSEYINFVFERTQYSSQILPLFEMFKGERMREIRISLIGL